MNELEKQCREFNPDVASLQFVCFGFHDKGLCFELPRRLRKLPVDRWHVMFHELWVGFSVVSPWKQRLLGFAQARIVARIVKELSPFFVTTSNDLYLELLSRNGIHADHLPLFGNFRVRSDEKSWISEELQLNGINIENRGDWFVVGIFGSVRFHFDLDNALHELGSEANGLGKKLLVLHAGDIDDPLQWLDDRLDANPGMDICLLGRCSSSQISSFLSILDVGLPSTQKQMIGKSGVAAAMHDHGVELRVLGDFPLPDFTSAINELKSPDDLFWPLSKVADRFVRRCGIYA